MIHEKVFSKRSYQEQRCMAFVPNYQCYGQIHNIVCLNMQKFDICVHNGTVNNAANQRFQHVSQINALFIF